MRVRSICMVVALVGCGGSTSSHQAALANARVTYFHQAYGAGPLLYTDAAGALIEERRYEPFGAGIDIADMSARDLDELDKRTDASTGWSDHGARWLQPETARWTSTDPPVEAPDDKFMAAPWKLHPYQYVSQNPVSYWDPDGRDDSDNPNQHLAPYVVYAGDATNLIASGFGLANGTTSDGVSVSAFHADVHVGKWTDSTGSKQSGIQATADVVKFVLPPGKAIPYIGLDGGFGNAEAGCYMSATDFACGAEANAADFAITAGTEQNYARFGIAAGMGAMLRLHYGDTNGDGKKEYGAGVDFMFVEADFRTDGEPGKAMVRKAIEMNVDMLDTAVDLQKSAANMVLGWLGDD